MNQNQSPSKQGLTMEFNKDITWKGVKKKDKRNKRKITGKPSQNNIEFDSIDHESLSNTLSE